MAGIILHLFDYNQRLNKKIIMVSWLQTIAFHTSNNVMKEKDQMNKFYTVEGRTYFKVIQTLNS